jgi:hypothetical protein
MTINKGHMVKIGILTLCLLCFFSKSITQAQVNKPDLSNSNHFRLVNRAITISSNNPERIEVHLNAKSGDGVAWINDIEFGKGIIEFDAKGKNVLQQSFIGVAFHGVNDSTFDAVYFRPFNFQSPDTIRRSHSVQYISLPQYDWSVLREQFPGKYEHKLTSIVDPESWFHVKIMIDTVITVYVDNDQQPSLTVKPINNHMTGGIGFWVGNNSDGDFANLIIKQ